MVLLQKDAKTQGISVILASNPRNPVGQVIKYAPQLKEVLRSQTYYVYAEERSWKISSLLGESQLQSSWMRLDGISSMHIL